MDQYPAGRQTKKPSEAPPHHVAHRRTVDGDSRPTFVTIVEPSFRPRLDAATHTAFVTVHTDSAAEALSAVDEYAARGVLLSPTFVYNQPLESLDRLVSKSLGTLVVAVVAEPHSGAADSLLGLGACGVRRAIDVSHKAGWDAVRRLARSGGGETGARILDEVAPILQTATREVQAFFGMMIRLAPRIPTARGFASQFRVSASTLTSRFFRAQLPSPKQYLARTRLLYAAAFLETPGASIADVAHALEYSSPRASGATCAQRGD